MVNDKFKTQCLNCKSPYNVSHKLFGQTINCPKCKEPFEVIPYQYAFSSSACNPPAKFETDDNLDYRNQTNTDSHLSHYTKQKVLCPYCKKEILVKVSNELMIKCIHCNKEFQTVSIDCQEDGITPTINKCQFCGNDSPLEAIRCKSCGNFTKYAKVTIVKAKDDVTSDVLAVLRSSIPNCQDIEIDTLKSKVPYTFQIDYSRAIELEIFLRNKGVVLFVDSGRFVETDDKADKNIASESEVNDQFSSMFTIGMLLKEMQKESSLFHAIFGRFASQRKDLFIISMIAIIPFFSKDLSVENQVIFFPVFLGILWAFIVLSFYGDGNVPLSTALKSFLFSSTVGVLMVFFISNFTGIFNFFPVFPRLFFKVGIVEEICKITPILMLTRRNKEQTLSLRYIDVFVLSMICGIGFGCFENILYKVRIDELIHFSTIYKPYLIHELSNKHLLRLISLPFLHGCWSGALGFIIYHGHKNGHFKTNLIWGTLLIGCVHTLYNYFIFNKAFGIVLVFSSIILINATYMLCRYIDRMNMQLLRDSVLSVP